MTISVDDRIGRLVGQITVDDVMDEVREQSERDYQLASGLSQDVETDDNVLRQTTARLPWLLIGMIGGIGNSMILGNFDSTFAAHPEMALYIPLIGGTGGNVGTQSSAIIVQGLANSSLDAKNTFKQITKESVVALINATIISLLVYTYNFIRFGATATVTYSVSISLFAVVMFASIFGTLVPMTLEKFKIDPAIATGPFIAITNDIIGMMLYMEKPVYFYKKNMTLKHTSHSRQTTIRINIHKPDNNKKRKIKRRSKCQNTTKKKKDI